MNNEHHQITLREVTPENPPKILEKMTEALEEILGKGVSAAGDFIKGKSGQELAKVSEIEAQAHSHLDNLELERQRLVAERDKSICDDNQKMYELKTKRLEAIVNCLVRLKEMDVNVQLVVSEKLIKAMDEK
jgi:hypothetical protein